jgi:predicted Zn-dependent protease with MMP-like domain
MAIKYAASPWVGALSPSISDIGKLAEQAYRAMPENFHALCGDIVLRIEEIADEDLIEFLGGNSPYDLLGLFHPNGLDPTGDELTGLDADIPTHAIVLYRRAIIDYWADSQESLDNIVTHIIVQEIGRQFGLDDNELEKVEAATQDEADRDARAMVQ